MRMERMVTHMHPTKIDASPVYMRELKIPSISGIDLVCEPNEINCSDNPTREETNQASTLQNRLVLNRN